MPERRDGRHPCCSRSQLISFFSGLLQLLGFAFSAACAASPPPASAARPCGRRSRRSTAAMSRVKQPLSRSILDQVGDRLILAVLRQLDRDAVVELQVPAAAANADIAFDPRRQLRIVLILSRKPAAVARRRGADEQRQHRHACRQRTARSPAVRSISESVLPCCQMREGLALLEARLRSYRDRPCGPRRPRPRAVSRSRSRAASTSKPISEVEPSRPKLSRISISEVSRLPETLTWSMAKPCGQ